MDFPVLQGRSALAKVVVGEESVLKPLKAYSQDAGVISPCDLTWGGNPGKEEEEEMEGSQVNVVSQVRGCVHFSFWNAIILETAKVYFCTLMPNKFVFNYFCPSLPSIVKFNSMVYVSPVSQSLLSTSSIQTSDMSSAIPTKN